MKRFASLATTAALAGSLVGAGTAAQALSNFYLVPISSLSTVYAPGAKVTFAAVMDYNNATTASFSIPTAVAYLGSQFGKPTLYRSVGRHRWTTRRTPATPSMTSPRPMRSPPPPRLIGAEKILAAQATPGHSADTDACDRHDNAGDPHRHLHAGDVLVPHCRWHHGFHGDGIPAHRLWLQQPVHQHGRVVYPGQRGAEHHHRQGLHHRRSPFPSRLRSSTTPRTSVR